MNKFLSVLLKIHNELSDDKVFYSILGRLKTLIREKGYYKHREIEEILVREHSGEFEKIREIVESGYKLGDQLEALGTISAFPMFVERPKRS